jgi:IrrE N-terminal-like domain
VKWVKDRTGRFGQRPHYLPEELDAECEKIIADFLVRKYQAVRYPISNDDLTVLVEGVTDDLDLYADLACEGQEVEGVTDFFRGSRPKVRIERNLTTDPRLVNRFRTTLTHELGHVTFHQFLFQGRETSGALFSAHSQSVSNKCKRETIVHAAYSDWMEWQAGYACGAFLMPATGVRDHIRAYAQEKDLSIVKFGVASDEGQGLITVVAEKFAVSRDAARVRLLQRGSLTEGQIEPSLF